MSLWKSRPKCCPIYFFIKIRTFYFSQKRWVNVRDTFDFFSKKLTQIKTIAQQAKMIPIWSPCRRVSAVFLSAYLNGSPFYFGAKTVEWEGCGGKPWGKKILERLSEKSWVRLAISRCHMEPGLPDFSRDNRPKLGKYTKITTKCNKWPQHLPYGSKIGQTAVKYTNIVLSKSFQNLPKFWFLFWKHAIWQPWQGPALLQKNNFRLRSVGPGTDVMILKIFSPKKIGESIGVFYSKAVNFHSIYL
jgi:hypothetical protein